MTISVRLLRAWLTVPAIHLCVMVTWMISACSSTDLDRGSQERSSAMDSAVADARLDARDRDAVVPANDAGPPEAGRPDAIIDAAVIDAAVIDAAVIDAAVIDATVIDGGTVMDGALIDATSDATLVDAGTSDAAVSTLEGYVVAPYDAPYAMFGGSVALSGDTLLIGAPQDNSGASGIDGDATDSSMHNSGAAHVFVRHGEQWTEQAYLKASQPVAYDRWGSEVALSDDTAVVAGGWADPGLVYVFVRVGSAWMQQAVLRASEGRASDRFGTSVAISDDTIVIGALDEDSDATGVNGDASNNRASMSGAAYVFDRIGTTWTQRAYLKASNSAREDAFGSEVAISGDTIVVSAIYEDSAGTGISGDQEDNSLESAGAVYVFERVAGIWAQTAYLKASAPSAYAQFGFGVAISGNVIAAARHYDPSRGIVEGMQIDIATVFERTSNGWVSAEVLRHTAGSGQNMFGLGMDNDRLVALHWAGSGCPVYVFRRIESQWTRTSSFFDAVRGFGTSVSVSGDTAAVGGPSSGAGGAVYVYRIH